MRRRRRLRGNNITPPCRRLLFCAPNKHAREHRPLALMRMCHATLQRTIARCISAANTTPRPPPKYQRRVSRRHMPRYRRFTYADAYCRDDAEALLYAAKMFAADADI